MDPVWSAKPQASWRSDPHEATQGELQGEYNIGYKNAAAIPIVQLQLLSPFRPRGNLWGLYDA